MEKLESFFLALECIFNLYFKKMGVSGFWEFASKTVVKSPRSPSLGQACHGLGFRPPLPLLWAGVWPLRGPSWQPCLVGEGAPGPGQEVRQSNNLETLKGAGGGERASAGLGVDRWGLQAQEASSEQGVM